MIVSSPSWIVACVLVSAIGYLAYLLLQGHSLVWTLRPAGRELLINQWVDLAANAGVVVLLVVLLCRFIGACSREPRWRPLRFGGGVTPRFAAAVRAQPVALLPRADAATLIDLLTNTERRVLALLVDGLVPKQAALELSVTLPTVRST